MMNSKLILVLICVIGFVTACLEYCPQECTASGCDVWVCESEFDCFCDDCYWFDDRISLNDAARVKKEVDQKLKISN